MLYDQAQLAVAYITASQVRVWIHDPAPLSQTLSLSASNPLQRDTFQPALCLWDDRSEAANKYTS